MAIYQHQGKWRVEIWLKGKRIFRQGGIPSELEARNIEKEAMENAQWINTDLLKLCEARLDELQLKRSKGHYQQNKVLIKKLIAIWGDTRRVSRIDRDLIEQYLNEVAKKSKAKANKDLVHMRALFNHAVKRGWIKANPTNGIEKFPATKSKRYIPTQEDIQKVMALAKPIDRLYLMTIAHTLGRVRGINNLKWEDIHEDYISIYTRKAKNSDLKEIRVPMNNTLKEVISQIPRQGEYVFINPRNGKPYDYRRKFLKTLCKKAKVKPFMFHALRHFGASKLDSMGISLTVIQEILGHERATTTDHYLQSIRGGVKDAMKKLEDLI